MNQLNDDHKHAVSPAQDSSKLIEELQQAAHEKIRPDETPYLSFKFADECRIVENTGYSHQEVQITALQNDIIPERYARNQKSISTAEQIRLLQSHVAVIGLGGLGGTVTEILARIGIGNLTLVDGDHFEDSNLNRQILSSTDVLGKMKADIATARVSALNPAVNVRPVFDFFSADNSQHILQKANIAVDCLDTIPDRFTLEESCKVQNIPLVSAAIGGTSGQVTVILPEDPGLKLIYGNPKDAPKRGVEATLGTLPYAAIAMAALECAEIVALAAGRPAQLRKQLLLADFRYYSIETVLFE
jgi:molybdopterin/thiamine biosynthesis adenylyltransferase